MDFVSSLPPTVRKPLSTVFRTAGRLTSEARLRPSFLVVGAQRAGTTSLHRTLKQHPSLVPPIHKKGIRYFDINYRHGDAWYQGHFPLKLSARRVSRRSGWPVYAYESTPYYMFHPLAPGRFARDLPGVRVVVVLRDPIERAYSAYTHERARGFETETFERALDLEEERLAGEVERMDADPAYTSAVHQHNAYLSRSRYVEQLERLEAAVGRDRMFVVDSADFFADPATTYGAVCSFFELPRYDDVVHEQHNARPRVTMDEGLRERLDEYFRPYDERLATWLGETPSWRR